MFNFLATASSIDLLDAGPLHSRKKANIGAISSWYRGSFSIVTTYKARRVLPRLMSPPSRKVYPWLSLLLIYLPA
jgi:hypothetical protein